MAGSCAVDWELMSSLMPHGGIEFVLMAGATVHNNDGCLLIRERGCKSICLCTLVSLIIPKSCAIAGNTNVPVSRLLTLLLLFSLLLPTLIIPVSLWFLSRFRRARSKQDVCTSAFILIFKTSKVWPPGASLQNVRFYQPPPDWPSPHPSVCHMSVLLFNGLMCDGWQ